MFLNTVVTTNSINCFPCMHLSFYMVKLGYRQYSRFFILKIPYGFIRSTLISDHPYSRRRCERVFWRAAGGFGVYAPCSNLLL